MKRSESLLRENLKIKNCIYQYYEKIYLSANLVDYVCKFFQNNFRNNYYIIRKWLIYQVFDYINLKCYF